MKIYLAHSVHERDRGKEVQKKLEAMGHKVYNPFYPDDIIREDIEAIERGDIMPWNLVDRKKSGLVCERDLVGVRQSDILIALYPTCRTVGIPCEMFFAGHSLHMDVYSSVPEDMVGHPWIVNYSKIVFTSDKELLDYVKIAKIRMFY